MADKRIMTPEEKALLQEKHRQEEAEARNRKKERDARTCVLYTSPSPRD